MIGWICPKCNRSVNPKLDHCDCNYYHGQPYTPFAPFRPFEPYKITWIGDNPTITTTGTNGNIDDKEKYEVKFNPL